MASGQRTGGGPVAEPASPHRRPRGGFVVADLDGRVVPDPPAGAGQSPDQIDVLADPELGVEGGRSHQGPPPDHQGGGRHVPHRPVGAHQAGVGPEVEGGAGVEVPGQGRAPDPRRPDPRRPDPHRPDPRRHRPHLRVVEQSDQVVEPSGPGQAVTVHERHQFGGHQRRPLVAGGRRPAADRTSHQAGTVAPTDRFHRPGVRRPVVHHQHLPAAQAPQAAVEEGAPVPHRHHHRHPAGIRRGARRVGPGGPCRPPPVGGPADGRPPTSGRPPGGRRWTPGRRR